LVLFFSFHPFGGFWNASRHQTTINTERHAENGRWTNWWSRVIVIGGVDTGSNCSSCSMTLGAMPITCQFFPQYVSPPPPPPPPAQFLTSSVAD
jgi:NADPH-dependent glutamate synthase beta subunit-like oxidoreductase